jgi:prolyl-tRNA synthetase
MKLSEVHIRTLREVPGEAETPSHIWLLRSGMIRRLASGIYCYMTMGWRSIRKVEQIVREEMDTHGAQEIITPVVHPAELWKESGRWQIYGPELWRLTDRHGREFCLQPTAEEVFTDIVRSEIDSWRQLPKNIYQIQIKYRDERRPRYGLMRCREFIMKDAYSFDRDEEGLEVSYLKMREAYTNVFTRCGLKFRPVLADNGAIGGTGSEEFVAMNEYGEISVAYCEACEMAANVERAEGVDAPADTEEMLPTEEIYTPETKTIEELINFVDVPVEKTLKALLFKHYGEDMDAIGVYYIKEYVAVFIRGDRELNMVKLQNVLGAADHMLEFADEVLMHEVTGMVGGFTGPVGLHDCKIITDTEVPGLRNLISGANKLDYHMKNVNYGRDWEADIVVDLKQVQDGDPCPVCGKPLKTTEGIEVGQIFKLGTRYSKDMNASYKDENQEDHLVVMGCYGIGVTRTMAAVVEQHHDEKGIIWPISVAPFHVIITVVKTDDEVQMALANEIYTELWAQGVEAVLDDRDLRPGVKFNDADIFGIPIRITVGKKAGEGIVEYKLRREQDVAEYAKADAIARASELVKKETSGYVTD